MGAARETILAALHARLGQTVGRTFQAGCDAALRDARCGVDLENVVYKGTGVGTELLRDRAFRASGLAGFEPGWFAFGPLTWTSGANAGRITEVLAHTLDGSSATLTLLEAPIRALAPGDSFVARAGCDKRIGTCAAKFANTVNFRGFPHSPDAMPETEVFYADNRGIFDDGYKFTFSRSEMDKETDRVTTRSRFIART